MANPKTPSVAKLEEQSVVAEYFAQHPHASDFDASKALGIERSKVYNHRRIIEQRYAVSSFESAQITRSKLVDRCRWAQREAAEAWERSKQGIDRKTQGKSTRSGGAQPAAQTPATPAVANDFAVVMHEGSSGNPQHMKNYLAALAQEARYSGADTLKIEHQVTVGAAQIIWITLVEFIPPEFREMAQLALAQAAEQYGREAARMTEAAAPMLVAPDEPIMADPAEGTPDA